MQNEEILIGALDESTTSTKFLIFNNKGTIIEQVQIPHEQITPSPGWLEHNPEEIIKNTWEAIELAMNSLKQKGITSKVKCLSVVNQRETIVAWDKKTGKPYYNAIVWCDTRTREISEKIIKSKGSKFFYRKINGLPINTYFSAFKILWLIENVPEIKANLENIYFGTIDTWVVWNLTNHYATDVSNASRTFLLNLQTVVWDESILSDFGLKKENFPEVRPSVADFGDLKQGQLKGVKITCILGDQQAAALGHAITVPGEVKHTYGTGCFLVMNTGDKPIIKENSGMLTSILFQLGEKEKVIYALEGAIETGGNTINWLKDNFEMFKDFDQMMEIITQIKEQGDVYFVPSFAGLFSPFWDDDVSGTIVGMTYHTTKAHMIRSVLEAICYRTKDVIDAMEKDSGINIPSLRVDGGLTVNEWILHYQSDLLQKKLFRSKTTQSTALGGVFGAGMYYGIFKVDQLKQISEVEFEVSPKEELAQDMANKYQKWLKVIKQMLIKIE